MERRRVVVVHQGGQAVSMSPGEEGIHLSDDKLFDRDQEGRPIITDVRARIGDMEHRLDYLRRHYDPAKAGPGRSRILGEILALRAGMMALKYHQLELGGDLSVITVLQELVDAVRDAESGPEYLHRLTVAMQKAEKCLSELEE